MFFSLVIIASIYYSWIYKSDYVSNVSDKKVVVLDPGHGGEDPGAVSDYNGIKEKDVNLIIANNVKGILQNENIEVLMTRSEDELVYEEGTTNVVQKRKQDLLNRKKFMDDSNANAIVSIHLNKFPRNEFWGAQTFYPAKPKESKKLAVEIQKVIREDVNPDNKREALEKKETIIILKDVVNPMAIVECGFLSNEEEEKNLGNSDYQVKLSQAIAKGIINFLNNNQN